MVDSAIWRRVYSKSPRFVSREVAGEHIFIPIQRKASEVDSLFTTNPAGSYIWNLIDGIRTVGVIRNALVAEFNVESDEAGRDLVEFLGQMVSAVAIREA